MLTPAAQASELIASLQTAFAKYTDAEKQALIKKVSGCALDGRTVLTGRADERHLRAPGQQRRQGDRDMDDRREEERVRVQGQGYP